MADNEHQFESDIEALMTGELGWRRPGAAASGTGQGKTYQRELALDLSTLVGFVKASQSKAWAFFAKACSGLDPQREFYKKFEDAVQADGMIDVLRNGFYANGKHFSVCFFKPENKLNETANADYEKNICEFHRQWHYSAKEPAKSVDLMLSVNGIPLVAIELKDQLTGQTVENAKLQWMTDRNPKEAAFRLNHRCLVFFAVDLNEAWMTTRLAGEETRFLPFNQGSAGAGEDGGAGTEGRGIRRGGAQGMSAPVRRPTISGGTFSRRILSWTSFRSSSTTTRRRRSLSSRASISSTPCANLSPT